MLQFFISAPAVAALVAATPVLAFADPPRSTYTRPTPPKPPPGPRGITQQGTDPDGQACTPQGFNANTTGYPPCEAGAASAQSSATPPRCSKTVKDHCVQAYERGVRR